MSERFTYQVTKDPDFGWVVRCLDDGGPDPLKRWQGALTEWGAHRIGRRCVKHLNRQARERQRATPYDTAPWPASPAVGEGDRDA